MGWKTSSLIEKWENVKKTDPEVYDALVNELQREEEGIELIASENFVSKAVLEAMGTPLTNKYSEGYPKKRYYSGNEFIDKTENLAIERAKKLFNAEHANVQPHAGSQANMEAYCALLEMGDKILAMDLSHGGHLTHGHPVNFSGKMFNFVHYGVDKESHQIDMQNVRKIALKEKPKMIVAGASAYPRTIDFQAFKEIADEINAFLLADVAHIAGLITTGLHPQAFPYCDVVTTTTHKTLRGPRGAMILCREEHAKKIDKMVFPGMQGGPMDHIIAAKAVAFHEALQPSFKDYCTQIIKNAKKLSDELQQRSFKVISGGTDNHLLLLDITSKGVSGKEAENLFEEVGLYTNKNMIPFDTRKPFDPSGIRIGTPAVTTRGFKEPQMQFIAQQMEDSINAKDDANKKSQLKAKSKELALKHPVYD
ncbi:MAG: serine hydroxymethyltransferase [Candidatus Micrarchaeia archaeon]